MAQRCARLLLGLALCLLLAPSGLGKEDDEVKGPVVKLRPAKQASEKVPPPPHKHQESASLGEKLNEAIKSEFNNSASTADEKETKFQALMNNTDADDAEVGGMGLSACCHAVPRAAACMLRHRIRLALQPSIPDLLPLLVLWNRQPRLRQWCASPQSHLRGVRGQPTQQLPEGGAPAAAPTTPCKLPQSLMWTGCVCLHANKKLA